MNCPRCRSPLAEHAAHCATCGLAVGATQSKGVPGWVWALVAGGVLVVIVPCACVGLFLVAGGRKLGGHGSSMTTSMESDAGPELAALPQALRAWSDAHADHAPKDLAELLGPNGHDTTYLPSGVLPRDSFGNLHAYHLDERADGWKIELTSLGADGAVGGEGEAADGSVLTLEWRHH
ncbi:MAG: type II secretion system protein GspG [Planctomycetes bacterium]|nr:type II secretion system protein GspG [Planctomycetota bacterium]